MIQFVTNTTICPLLHRLTIWNPEMIETANEIPHFFTFQSSTTSTLHLKMLYI